MTGEGSRQQDSYNRVIIGFQDHSDGFTDRRFVVDGHNSFRAPSYHNRPRWQGAPTVEKSTGQRKVKSGALTHFGFGPDASAVALDDSLNDGQSDARAFEFLA